MFKKPVEAKSHQRLSGADRKKLRRTIKDRFPNASDAEIDVLIPPKVEITLSKLANRAHVYSVEGGFPMFFDVDGRGTDVFPTVFALWQVPQLLPTFELKGGEVSRFVIGGADLMFPGIRIPEEGLSSFSSGELWAVKVPGNASPIAVGTTTISRAEAIKAGLRGKALRIAHYYRDSLWGSVEGHYVPNAGFYEDVVIEDPALLLSSHPADESDSCKGTPDSCKGMSDTLKNDDGNVADQEELPEASGDIEIDKDIIVKSQKEVDEYIPEKLIGDTDSLTISDVVSSEEANSDSHNLIPEEVDALLDKCLLQALHVSVKDKDIPMAGSILWSVHVLPCRPSGVTLDIKRSSHKKLSKWLQSKASIGLITVKEDKHKKETILQAVNRLHPDYTSFRPEKRQIDLSQQCSISASESKPKKLQIDVSEIFKASTHVAPILTSVGAEPGNFYTAAEATDIVFRYIEMENLVKPTDKAKVVLNATLCDALYKGAIKKGSSYPTEIHKKDLGATFLNRMQVHYKVVRGNEAAVRKGSVKPVQIMTERRQGNKKVTRVSGIETFLMDAEALASELQKKFACSTTVAELPGKKGQHEVLVQGGVIDDLAKQLVDHYGIPKRYIEVLDKTRR